MQTAAVRTLAVIIALFGAFAVPLPARAATDTEDRPNIIFIFSDDHAWQAISAYGSNRNETPHIDRIAAGGMRFNNCSVTNSICAPSRATILTGTHAHVNGNISNERLFNREQPMFPPLLQGAGYRTVLIGKYHLRTEPRGFDHYDILINQGTYYNPRMIRNGARVERMGYTTEIITDLALEWLREHGSDHGAGGSVGDEGKPFMLMVQHKAPHRQWDPGPDHLTMFDGVDLPEPPTLFDDFEGRSSAQSHATMSIAEHLSPGDLHLVFPEWQLNDAQLALWERTYGPKNEAFREAKLHGDDLVRWKYQRYAKDYLRCVAAIDDGVGRILDYLDESGLVDNTIVVYSSDQGWYLGEHGWYDKRWMYEESFRTPLLVRWPGVTEAGSINDDLVQNLDFAQTFLEIAGAPAPERTQGRSLVPLLRGETPADWRQSVYYRFYENRGPHTVPRHEGVATRTHKLINFYGIGEWEMYDLVRDPDELNSVYEDPAYAGLRATLKDELSRLRDRYGVTDESDAEYDRHEDALADRRRFQRLLGHRPGIWSRGIIEGGSAKESGVERTSLALVVGGREVPCFLYEPTEAQGLRPGVLLIHDEAADVDVDGSVGRASVAATAARLATRGFVVLTPDRFGHGDRRPGGVSSVGREQADYIERAADRLIAEGSSLLGVTMSELQVALKHLMRHPRVHEKRIAVVGSGFGGTLAAVLGFLDEDVTAVAAIGGASSFRNVLDDGPIASASALRTPGLLAWGEMDDVLNGIYPRPVSLIRLGDSLRATYPRTAARYEALAVEDDGQVAFQRLRAEGVSDAENLLIRWLDRWLLDPYTGDA